MICRLPAAATLFVALFLSGTIDPPPPRPDTLPMTPADAAAWLDTLTPPTTSVPPSLPSAQITPPPLSVVTYTAALMDATGHPLLPVPLRAADGDDATVTDEWPLTLEAAGIPITLLLGHHLSVTATPVPDTTGRLRFAVDVTVTRLAATQPLSTVTNALTAVLYLRPGDYVTLPLHGPDRDTLVIDVAVPSPAIGNDSVSNP